jgi:hypothetical protein
MSSLIQIFFMEFIMNLIYKKPLIVAIAAAVGSFIPLGNVLAEPIQPDADGVYTPIYVPLEAAEKSASYNSAYEGGAGATGVGATTDPIKGRGHLDVYIYTLPGYPVSANKTLTVRVALTNGATFADKPYLVCPMTAGTDSPTDFSAIAYGDVGQPNDLATDITNASVKSAYIIGPFAYSATLTAVSFEFPQGLNMPEGQSGICLLTYSGNLALAAAIADTAYYPTIKAKTFGQDVSMNVTVTYQDLFNSASVTNTIPVIKAVTALKVEAFKYSEGTSKSAAFAEIDVKKLSKEFIDKTDNSVTTVFAGEIQISPVTAMSKLRSVTGVILSATDILTTATITISGPTVATLSKITFVPGANTVDCDATPHGEATPTTTTVTTSGGSSSSSSSDAKVSFISTDDGFLDLLHAVTAEGSYSGLHVCLVANGTNIMAEGPLTVTINGSKGSAETEIGTGELVTVTKNGTVVRVLNIPGIKSPDLGYIRLYNTGTQEFTVTGTLYGEDGKPIGNEGITLISSLKPNDVRALSRADLETLAGKTWEGRAWMMIQAPTSSSSFKVTATVRAAGGALTNVSSDAMD